MTATAIPNAKPVYETPVTPMLHFAFQAFCIFNIAVYSRFFEWKLSFLHIPLLTSCIALMGAGFDGRVLSVFGNRIGTCMGALTLIYATTIPFSAWRGGSFDAFVNHWLKSLMAFMIAGAVLVTFRQCRTALSTIGWGSGIAAALALTVGRNSSDGRLEMSAGTLGNPNDLASLLLLGLPLLWLIVSDQDTNKLKRAMAFAVILMSLVALIRSGSRTGLIGLVILSILMFFRTSIAGKVVVVAGMLSVGLVAIVAFPAIVQRYETMFLGRAALALAHTQAEEETISSAVSSSDARRALLIASLKATASHPILGVGVGVFGAYEANMDTSLGIRANYQGTHNTYTQVSSEDGIPAFLIFISIMAFVFSDLLKVFRRARRSPTKVGRQVANVSFALLASLVAYSVYIFFDFVAYDLTLPVLAGFSIALTATAGNALAVAESGNDDGPPPVEITILPPRRRPLQQAVRGSAAPSAGSPRAADTVHT